MTQQALREKFLNIYPNAQVKKIDADNYLDIHLPDVHEKRGTHIFFNTAGAVIKLGFYCRDEEFVEKTLLQSSSLEKYAQGVRLKDNPVYSNVDDAINGATSLINAIKGRENNLSPQNTEEELERDWNFPVSLAYIFQAFATYIDGNVSSQVTSAIKVALQEWLNGTSQSEQLAEVLETANQYLKEDANSPDGVKTIMQNFFYLGEHMNSVLPDELKNEVMRDLVNIASADADLNETEEKWIKGFGRALGVVPMS